MARLNAKWYNFFQRGQTWYHFWQDTSASGGSPINVTPSTGVIIIIGYAPTVVASDNKNVLAGTGILILTGYSPVVSVTNHINVSPGTGVLVLLGYAPTVVGTAESTTSRIKKKRLLYPIIRKRGFRK